MGKNGRVRFPSIKEVAALLRAENATLDYPDAQPGFGEDTVSYDVRLQVYPSGEWAVHVGDSQYDQDHRGFWGSSSLPGAGKRFSSEETARDLIDQAKDHEAQSR